MIVKHFFIASCLLISADTMAQEAKAMMVSTVEGAGHSIELSNIRSIRYQGEMMIVIHKDGELSQFSVYDVSSITFCSVAMAVEHLSDGKAGVSFTVCDINGRKVCEGVTGSDGDVCGKISLNGVYLVKIGDKTKKIIILNKK